ncbi:MAG TPA: hypothetical protein VGB42_04445 [Candidatus Thermoplasmatota archaeon]
MGSPPLVYLAHPLPSYNTPTEAAAILALARAFPAATVLNPRDVYTSNQDFVERYRQEVARSSVLVFFPWRGAIGYGVHCEVVAADDSGLPTYMLHDGRLYAKWSLDLLGGGNAYRRYARVRPMGRPIRPTQLLTLARARRVQAIPSGPLGRVVENRIIEYLIILSEGRLIVFRPESDFGGTDLQVSRRHGKAVIKLQVKARTGHDEHGDIHVHVHRSQIPPEDPKHIVFAEYFPKTAELGSYLWTVSSEDYRRGAYVSGGYYKASMSPRPDTRDRWSRYRHPPKEIAQVVEALLDSAARVARRTRPGRR